MEDALWLHVSALFFIATASCAPDLCSCSNTTMDCSYRNRTLISSSESCSGATTTRVEGNNLLRQTSQQLKSDTANHVSISHISDVKAPEDIFSISSDQISLQELDVRGNQITSLSFIPVPCLIRKLEAAWNRIASIDSLYQCSRLVELNLAHNNISNLPSGIFRQMIRLKLLVLSANNLTSLPANVFVSLVNLKELRLDANRIVHVSDSQFAGLRSLRRLTLAGNRLATVPLLGDCCAGHVEWASFARNEIRCAPKASLRPLLGSGDTRRAVDLSGNPLRAPSLRWVLSAKAPLRATVDADACACGEVRLGRASVRLCVSEKCGRGTGASDWLDAVRADWLRDDQREIDDETCF